MPQPPKPGLHTQIRDLIFSSFSLEEFRTLCADLGIPYDDLPGEGLNARIRELILRLDREHRLDDLLKFCAYLRPDLNWPSTTVTQVALTRHKIASSIMIQPPVTKTVHTLVVDQLARGDYETISSAIQNAKPGDRILIHKGIYVETLVIDKPLEIIGDGELGDVQVHAQNDNVIRFMSTAGEIRKLTLRLFSGEKRAAIHISQGHLRLEDCDISSQSLACIEISNSGTTPTIRGNKIHGGKAGGIFIHSNGQGLIEANEIWGNANSGIVIRNAATPIIRNNDIHDGQSNGISVDDARHCIIEFNEIRGNSSHGIVIKSNSAPIVRGNKIHDNKQVGILVRDNAQGVIEANEIWNNTYAGIEINSGSIPIVRSNKIHDGKHSGVYLNYMGLGLFENNEIWGNAYHGIEIRDSSIPIVRGNTISKNEYYAIMIYEKGGGTFENNDLRNNAMGAWNISSDSQELIKKKNNRTR